MLPVFFSDALDLVHALLQQFLAAFAGGVVVTAVAEAFGEAVHASYFAFDVVGVLVVAAVVEILQEFGRRVAQVQRNGLGAGVLDVLGDRAPGGVDRIDLGASAR